MTYSSVYAIPDRPPRDALAELDRAAHVLDELTARAVELTLGLDRQSRGLRIELTEGERTRRLTPTELFELLDGADVL